MSVLAGHGMVPLNCFEFDGLVFGTILKHLGYACIHLGQDLG
ncbi:hypothetical protein [uncultured Cohaesibacter sp.]|nr:hypothetical protein [uncultured Cohaesibacter sp.]